MKPADVARQLDQEADALEESARNLRILARRLRGSPAQALQKLRAAGAERGDWEGLDDSD